MDGASIHMIFAWTEPGRTPDAPRTESLVTRSLGHPDASPDILAAGSSLGTSGFDPQSQPEHFLAKDGMGHRSSSAFSHAIHHERRVKAVLWNLGGRNDKAIFGHEIPDRVAILLLIFGGLQHLETFLCPGKDWGGVVFNNIVDGSNLFPAARRGGFRRTFRN